LYHKCDEFGDYSSRYTMHTFSLNSKSTTLARKFI